MSLLAPRPIRLTAATIRLPTPPLPCCCTHTRFATRHFPLLSVTVLLCLLLHYKVLHFTSLQCTLPWRGSVWTCSKATGSLLHNFLIAQVDTFALRRSLEKGMARMNRGGGVSRLQFSLVSISSSMTSTFQAWWNERRT
jgi:hypothetical protein